MIFLRLQRITRVSFLKTTNCNMVTPTTLKTFHCIFTLFSTISFFHTNKTMPLFKQNFFTYFRFCNYITKFCFMVSTTKDTRVLKAAFTLIYILIVNILSANKIIYKWPHLYFKTQIHK